MPLRGDFEFYEVTLGALDWRVGCSGVDQDDEDKPLDRVQVKGQDVAQALGDPHRSPNFSRYASRSKSRAWRK
jgi:hypothetical protein